MVIRIRLRYGSRTRRAIAWNRRAALAVSALMMPIALVAWVLAGWRLAADLGWAEEFAIRSGLFSRWQVWVAVGIGIQFAAFLLHRLGGKDDDYDGGVALL